MSLSRPALLSRWFSFFPGRIGSPGESAQIFPNVSNFSSRIFFPSPDDGASGVALRLRCSGEGLRSHLSGKNSYLQGGPRRKLVISTVNMQFEGPGHNPGNIRLNMQLKFSKRHRKLVLEVLSCPGTYMLRCYISCSGHRYTPAKTPNTKGNATSCKSAFQQQGS